MQNGAELVGENQSARRTLRVASEIEKELDAMLNHFSCCKILFKWRNSRPSIASIMTSLFELDIVSLFGNRVMGIDILNINNLAHLAHTTPNFDILEIDRQAAINKLLAEKFPDDAPSSTGTSTTTTTIAKTNELSCERMSMKVRPTVIDILQLRSVLSERIQPRHFFKSDRDERDFCHTLLACVKTPIELRSMHPLQFGFCLFTFHRLASLCAQDSYDSMNRKCMGRPRMMDDLFWPLFELQPTSINGTNTSISASEVKDSKSRPSMTAMAAMDVRYAWFVGNPSTAGPTCNSRYPMMRDCTPLPAVLSSLTLEYEFLNTLDAGADHLFIGRLLTTPESLAESREDTKNAEDEKSENGSRVSASVFSPGYRRKFGSLFP